MPLQRPVVRVVRIRGAGEALQLTLALGGVEYGVDEPLPLSPSLCSAAKQPPLLPSAASPAASPAAAPCYQDEHVSIGLATVTIRHLGRLHQLYGETLSDQAHIDMVLDSCEELRRKFQLLVHGEALFGVQQEVAKRVYWMDVLDASSAHRNGHTHFAFLSELVKHNGAGRAWAAGDKPSIADVLLFDVVQLHCCAFGEEAVRAAYPEIVDLKCRFAQLPRIAEYLARRPAPPL